MEFASQLGYTYRSLKEVRMRAVVCTRYGPPEVLKIEQVEKPVPKDNEILIKVLATTVTSADSRVRGFRVPISFWLPARIALGFTRPKRAILGSELSGEIESVGKDVKKFKNNDRVIGYLGHDLFGANAEYVCMAENGGLAIKPPNLTFEQAAAIPFGGITALYFLKKAGVHNGQKVLIYGASGSVGTYAVQLAKYFGAEVTGVTSAANDALVKSIGADAVIDYTKEDFTKNGVTYDVILDAVGKTNVSRCLTALKEEGTYVNIVAAPATMLKMRWASLRTKKKLIGGTAVPSAENLIFLTDLAGLGKITPVIDRVYPLEQIVDAHRYVDQGLKRGIVVIATVCCK